jgi:flagellar biosynthetic protein FliP
VLLLANSDAPAQDPKTPREAQPTAGHPAPAGPADDFSGPIKIVLVLTALAVVPAILMTVTSFTRIIIVLSFVRRALSIQEMPPNQVLIGLSLFLTLVVMNPVVSEVHDQALGPYLDGKLGLREAGTKAAGSLSTFLRGQTREEDVLLLADLTRAGTPETAEDLPLHVLVPAFTLSELRTAFQMGFLVYLPFLIVDLVVASVLLSMGMFMLPPVIISTPFKILLFVLVDGWNLVVKSLFQSFQI